MTLTAPVRILRDRLAAAFPLARDVTGSPHPTAESDLPAFAVEAEVAGSEIFAMGDPDLVVETRLSAILWAVVPADPDTLDRHAVLAALASFALVGGFGVASTAAPTIADARLEVEASDARILRAEVVLSLSHLATDVADPADLTAAGLA